MDKLQKTLRPRPALPPLLLSALVFWISTALTYSTVANLPADLLVVPCIVLGSVSLCCLLAGLKTKKLLVIIMAFLGLGALLGFMATIHYQTLSSAALQAQEKNYTFRILEDPSVSSRAASYVAQTRLDNGVAVKVRLYVPLSAEKLRYGESITACTKFKEPSQAARASARSKGIHAVAYLEDNVAKIDNNSFLSVLLQARNHSLDVLSFYPGESTEMLKAILAGDRSNLYDTDLYQNVKVCGLAHLVAVSGAHLVIVSSLVSVILMRCSCSHAVKAVLQILFLVAYLFFVGFPLSCFRACVMCALSFCAPLFMRRSSALSSLGIVIVLFILLDPTTALSVSFALSLLATLGIVLFVPLLVSFIPARFAQNHKQICDSFVMTLAATLFTFPLSTALFAQFSLVAPLANIVATPFLTFICTFGLIALVLSVVPFIGPLLLLVLSFSAQVFSGVISLLARVPHASIPISVNLVVGYCVVGVIAALLWITWSRKGFVVIAGMSALSALLVCSVLFVKPAQDEIIMLDVGQGDAFVIRSKNINLLVDTGNQSSMLLRALARHNIAHLDAVLITHADDDHCGSLADLRGIVPIDRILLAKGTKSSVEENPHELYLSAKKIVSERGIIELARNDTLSVGNFSLRILSPQVIEEGGNEDSLCFLLQTNYQQPDGTTFDALFTGDAEAPVEEEFIGPYGVSQIDAYKVPHHGSKKSVTEDIAKTLNPQVAFISVGAANTYGHPNRQIMDYLQNVGCKVFRSDTQGDVVCKISPNQTNVVTMK